ncbi:hypothetical Protein YC6258_03963 [Gynuella sunshinyii YC6258]|uniref:Uncharacterized protein n=1 Tax=Gynuella sunshinyii YC6258 TaxID=1445510 RepID=A0A0C5VZZ1_9GAMM|nr:hypothetical Protein YC6258_03963 [Gynuella sunshinyii YC6258]
MIQNRIYVKYIDNKTPETFYAFYMHEKLIRVDKNRCHITGLNDEKCFYINENIFQPMSC